MAGLQIPGVPPEPLPAIVDNQIMRSEDGTIYIVHIIANSGGAAMAWIPLEHANRILTGLANAIKEAHAMPRLVVAQTIPNGVPHA